MVLSLVVILAVVGAVLLFAPQPGAVEQPQVADAEAVAAVGQAAEALQAAPLLLVGGSGSAGLQPEDVPPASDVVAVGDDWRLDYARTETTDEVATWRVGVLSPQQRRVDLEQAIDPGDEWLTRADAGRPGPPEPVEVGGLSWSRQVRGDGDTAYTHVPDGSGGATGLTTTVTATSDSEDLQAVVAMVAASITG